MPGARGTWLTGVTGRLGEGAATAGAGWGWAEPPAEAAGRWGWREWPGAHEWGECSTWLNEKRKRDVPNWNKTLRSLLEATCSRSGFGIWLIALPDPSHGETAKGCLSWGMWPTLEGCNWGDLAEKLLARINWPCQPCWVGHWHHLRQ